MMVTYVRGHFKNVSGSLVFDPDTPAQSSAEVTIDAGTIWTGQPQRDAHLRSADFLDVEHHPRITFTGNQVEIVGARDYILRGALTIRGVSREVELKVNYLGQWRTPWWEEKDGKWIDKGPRVRAAHDVDIRLFEQAVVAPSVHVQLATNAESARLLILGPGRRQRELVGSKSPAGCASAATAAA
jgi:hypothetical protein